MSDGKQHPLFDCHIAAALIKSAECLVAKNAGQEIVKRTVLLRLVLVIGQDLRQGDEGLLNDVIGIEGRETLPKIGKHHRLVAGIEHRPAGMARVGHIPKECR